MIHDCSTDDRLDVFFDTSFASLAANLNSRIHVLAPDDPTTNSIISVDQLDCKKNYVKAVFTKEVSQTTAYRVEEILRAFWAAHFDGREEGKGDLDAVLGHNCYGELIQLVKMLITFARQVTINNNK